MSQMKKTQKVANLNKKRSFIDSPRDRHKILFSLSDTFSLDDKKFEASEIVSLRECLMHIQIESEFV